MYTIYTSRQTFRYKETNDVQNNTQALRMIMLQIIPQDLSYSLYLIMMLRGA